jgi:Fic family protein
MVQAPNSALHGGPAQPQRFIAESAHNLGMNPQETHYIWQTPDWPIWRYDTQPLGVQLASVHAAQVLLFQGLSTVGMEVREHAHLSALTEEVVKTSAIEGDVLDAHSVRSSIAQRLGLDIGALAPVDRHVDGVVEMALDAAHHCHAPLTRERLWGWQAALFPTGYAGLLPIHVGGWRSDACGPMQVVSGRIGRQQVHFQAPPADRLAAETAQFIAWANAPPQEEPLIKAAIAHLWFVTLHPFEDGNGRVARAIGDLFLARADGCEQRLYSMSAQIQRERKAYYAILEHTQKTSLDITPWLVWFLDALHAAVLQAQQTLDAVLAKAMFWQHWAGTALNPRQVKLSNRLLDGFDGKLTRSKWAAIAKCSADTALCDINEMLALGILNKLDTGGRSISYVLTPTPTPPCAS